MTDHPGPANLALVGVVSLAVRIFRLYAGVERHANPPGDEMVQYSYAGLFSSWS